MVDENSSHLRDDAMATGRQRTFKNASPSGSSNSILNYLTLKAKALRPFETSVNIYQSIRRNIPRRLECST